MTDETIFHGFAVNLDGTPLNGARGSLRDPDAPLDLVVGHLWVSPEDGPVRYLAHLAKANLPGVSGRVFQSRSSATGEWYWETPTGGKTTDPNAAKRFVGKTGLYVYRTDADPYPLVSGISPMPWCFGAGYHGVAGGDAEPYWAADPRLVRANHAPPVNDRSIGFCLPGRYQTRHEWLAVGKSRDFIRAFAKAIVWAHFRHGIPIHHVTEAELRRNRRARGYTDHVTVNNVFHQSDHGDLGAEFPWDVLTQDIADLLEGDIMKLIKVAGPAEHAQFAASMSDDGSVQLRYLTHCDEALALQRAGMLETTVREVVKQDLRWMTLLGPLPPVSVSTVKAADFARWFP